jgi:hypothetical protein
MIQQFYLKTNKIPIGVRPIPVPLHGKNNERNKIDKKYLSNFE